MYISTCERNGVKFVWNFEGYFDEFWEFLYNALFLLEIDQVKGKWGKS